MVKTTKSLLSHIENLHKTKEYNDVNKQSPKVQLLDSIIAKLVQVHKNIIINNNNNHNQFLSDYVRSAIWIR